jgi:hypothetical protein
MLPATPEELKEFCEIRIDEMEELSLTALEEGDDDTASYLEGAMDAYSIVYSMLGGKLEE